MNNATLDRNIRQCLAYAIKHDGPFRWEPIVGFSKEEFIEHLKNNFKDGMTIENYGEKWCISFIIPKRCFNFKSIKDEEFRKFYSLKNIIPRPLSEAQHQKKVIKKEELDKYGLWDIIPQNFDKYLVD